MTTLFSPRILGPLLLSGVLVMFLLGVDELDLRAKATDAAARSGLPCMALSDPTAGANPLPEEHRLLRQADPAGERYFLSAQVLATALDGSTFQRCFGPLNSNNPVATNIIFLNRDRLRTPALGAVALSHELIHVQHGDPTTPLGRHTLLQHLWRPEEAEAHLRGLQTARALHTSLPYPVWQDRILSIDTLPIFYGLCLLDCALFAMAFKAHPIPPAQSSTAKHGSRHV